MIIFVLKGCQAPTGGGEIVFLIKGGSCHISPTEESGPGPAARGSPHRGGVWPERTGTSWFSPVTSSLESGKTQPAELTAALSAMFSFTAPWKAGVPSDARGGREGHVPRLGSFKDECHFLSENILRNVSFSRSDVCAGGLTQPDSLACFLGDVGTVL